MHHRRPFPFARALLAIECAFFAALAAFLLAAPARFYAVVPGVAASGPANLHLLRDVGIAYLVIATGLACALRDVRWSRAATAAAALYLVLHAILHAAMETAAGDRVAAAAETPGVYLPALAAAAIAFFTWRKPAAVKDAGPQSVSE